MKRNILMVYPEFPLTYWSLKHALPFVNKKSSIIPLGLLTVAAMLPPDYQVKLVDMNVDRLDRKDVENADLVFISAMIVQKESMDSVIALCNECGTPVVAGGPYPTSSHGSIRGVDHFVLNEAELTLQPFLDDYEAGRAGQLYTDSRKPDLAMTPPPRFDLIDIHAYQNVALQNSRGCPFNCEFCDIIELFGRKPRFKDPAQFVREMELVYRTGFRGSLFIVDDNFIGNKPKVKELLRRIIAWQNTRGYPFSLFTEASIDMAADDELLDLMTEAGFDMVFVGIETPDAGSLASCHKSQNLRADLFESISKIQERGIEVTGGFIVGFDSDTEDIFDRQIEFIQKAGIPMAMVGLLGALPNTQLYRRLQKEGRLKPEVQWKGNNTHELRMSFYPVMPEATLVAGYKKIMSAIYSPKNYFQRCFTFIDRLPAGKSKYPFRIRYNEIRALLMSLFRQTFSRYGFHYLQFLVKVITRRPRYFPEAISFAVKGHHFFIMTENIMKADEFSSQLDSARDFFLKSAGEREVATAGAPATGTAKARRRLVYLDRRLRRKYRRLSLDVQVYLRDQFADFEKAFTKSLKAVKRTYKPG
jgi:radical SAM superfamily enzyme YgiQ (UPF0313 family)